MSSLLLRRSVGITTALPALARLSSFHRLNPSKFVFSPRRGLSSSSSGFDSEVAPDAARTTPTPAAEPTEPSETADIEAADKDSSEPPTLMRYKSRRQPVVVPLAKKWSWEEEIPDSPTEDFEGEPTGPNVQTAIVPGPESLRLLRELNTIQDAQTQHFFVDYPKCVGNYIVDADGNQFLDTFCSIATHSVGYNNPRILEKARSDEWTSLLVNRPALGIHPNANYGNILQNSLMRVAPKGLPLVWTTMCGACAVETSFKACFLAFARKFRGDRPPNDSEKYSAVINEEPGSPNYCVISFEGAFHGRILGALSSTHSKAIHKLDFPSFKWPIAPFPRLSYPLEENEVDNALEEDRCLESIEALIDEYKSKKPYPVALIIEGIQGEGGDRECSFSFYNALRNLCLDKEVFFIVDEVQTGCGSTGDFWAHEAWDLDVPPDAVTFGKKMQITGFFHAEALRPDMGYRQFNTWMGDPVRTLLAGAIIDEIERGKLLENVRITGEFFRKGLNELMAKYPDVIVAVRGRGMFVAFTCYDTETRDRIISSLRNAGIETGGSGLKTIRFRPQLIFKPKHAAIVLEALRQCLKNFRMTTHQF